MYKLCFEYNKWRKFHELEIYQRREKYTLLIHSMIIVGTGFGIFDENHTTMQTFLFILTNRAHQTGQTTQWQPTDFLDKKQHSR